MTRLLLSLILSLILPLSGWGATYYVKKIDGTIYYKSSTVPTVADASVGDLEAFDELAAVHDADTVYICKGTFTGTEIDADSSLSLTKKYAYFGPLLPSDPNYATDGGEVYLDANGASLSGSGVLRTDTAAVTPGACIIGAFKIGNTVYSTGSTYAVYNNANGWQFDGVHTYHTERGFYIVHTDVVLNDVKIEQASAVAVYSTKSYVWNYGIIHDALSGINCNGVSPTLNNVVINGISTEAIYNQNTGTVTCNNCAVLNSCLTSTTKHPITNSSTGVITLNNGIVLPNSKARTRISTGGTVNLNDVSYKMPLFRHSRRPAVVVFGVDDSGSLGYFNTVVAPALATYGWRGTLAISEPESVSSDDWATVNTLYAAGHDFAVHGDTFANKMTDLTGFRIQYVGAGSAATMTIADNILTTACTGDAGSNLNIDLTNASYDGLTELCAYIDGLAGYTCTRLNTDTSIKINTAYLADITGEGIKASAYDAAFDADKVYDGEMTAVKTSIEANIPGYTADIFVAPGNASDASMRTGMAARGIVFARGDGTSSSHEMSSLTVHNVTPSSLYVFFGNDANPQNTAGKVEQYMGAYLEYLAWMGGITWFYAHDTDEFTADAWAAVLAVVKKHGGITVLPAKQAYSYIVANGTTADSGVTYTRTFTDASDYRLRPGSPAINAGMNSVSGTVTLANTRLSLVSTAPFVDFSAAGTLTPYIGGYVTLTDSAGKTARARILSAGTGETYGSTLNVSNCLNMASPYDYNTFDGVSPTAFHAVQSGAGTKIVTTADELALTLGRVYLIEFSATLTSGAAPYTGLRDTFGGTAAAGAAKQTTAGNNAYYRTVATAMTGLLRFDTTAASEYTIASLNIRNVLSPSATGVVTSAWTIQAGFNYNDNYTYLITDFLPTTDYAGRAIRGLPDIGAYEFYGGAGQLGMGIIYGF